MDINLRDISGFEALAILLNDPKTVDIPVLAISANAMPRDVRKGLDSGFLNYITKPIRVSEVMDALTQALELVKAKAAQPKTNVKIETEVL
jgi:CheY-like chemotaxis protein